MAAQSLPSHPLPRGFVDLDDRILGRAPGTVVILAPTPDLAAAAGAHLVRRLAAMSVPTVCARAGESTPVFREVESQLGLSGGSCDVSRCAAEIAHAAHGAAIIVPVPPRGSWDWAVLGDLVTTPGAHLLIVTTDSTEAAAELHAETFEVGHKMDALDRQRWFAAVAEQASSDVDIDDLATLDASFANVRRGMLSRPEGQAWVPPEGKDLLVSLAVLGRAWRLADLAALAGGSEAALGSLVEAGIVRCTRGYVALEPGWSRHAEEAYAAADASAMSRAAEMLSVRFEHDPWARARAAELWLRAGSHPKADAAHAQAVAHADDPLARREIVDRWTAALSDLARDTRLHLYSRAAERALASGRAEEAIHFSELAAALAPDDPQVALLLGRAKVALGDLVAAVVAFERGQSQATTGKQRTLFTVELAEVAYLRGDLAEATRNAAAAVEAAEEPAVKLDARNTLGKIMLAEGRWDDADRHFEEDAWLASSSSLLTAELRARSNRAIAVLSKGLVDKARSLFEAVLAEGERRGETRACAFALDNLAVVASQQHKYAAALELWERAFKLRQQLGDRTALTHILGNLARIRLTLGLWEHAEHAIAFGRRMLGPGTPVARSAYFAICAANVALMRRNTVQARREAGLAIPESRSAGHAKYLAEALRVMTRIELEEGDLQRARDALSAANESATTEEGRAESRLLEAQLARASGDCDPQIALDALALCRTTDNEELLIEAQTLVCEIYRTTGNLDAARRHLDQAIMLRDQVAETLPADVRPAFVARPDMVSLARLDALLRDPPVSSGEALTASRATSRGDQVPRELIGEDTAIRSLLVAVKKIARSSCTVLIRGESGTGKELIAQALHAASERASGPLVTVNCAALVETLLLSELFGHEKGAFTGAVGRRRGRFELAEGGTLFLDEIGDISPRTQVALLRVLQERTFERVGGAVPIHVNVRIVCATHRDLKAMVERGDFRQDLYYRLRGVTLDVPPLRSRMGDLTLIADHLLARIATERGDAQKCLASDALELLTRHRWPGNVRELENALRATSLFAEGNLITLHDLIVNVDDLRLVNDALRPSSTPPPADVGDAGLEPNEHSATTIAYAQVRGGGASLSDIKRQIERDCIARALAETKGNITRAAVLLGMKRPRLSQLVKAYGLLGSSGPSEAS